jgi:hypothetical protein
LQTTQNPTPSFGTINYPDSKGFSFPGGEFSGVAPILKFDGKLISLSAQLAKALCFCIVGMRFSVALNESRPVESRQPAFSA